MTELKKYLFCVAALVCSAAPGWSQNQAVPASLEIDSLIEVMNNSTDDESEFSARDGQKDYYQESIKQQEFNKNEWERVRKGLDYNEAPEKPKEKEEPKKKEDGEKEKTDYEKNEGSAGGWFGGSGIGQVLLIICAAALLGFLLVVLFRGRVSNTKVKKKEVYSIEEIEESLHESDLERFLRESIEKREYRLAIRIYYLMAIKELSARDWIAWKKDKTNNQYLFEMSHRPNYELFREITRLFECTWYGEMTVGEQQFSMLDPRFREFLNQLKHTPA